MVGNEVWRIIRAGSLFVAAVVVALNIENLAVFFGWDSGLVSLATYVPVQFRYVWNVITAPTVLVSSIVFLAFTAGTQWDRFLKHQRATQISEPKRREAMAIWWERVAHAIDVSAELYDNNPWIMDGTDWQLLQMQREIRHYTGVRLKYRTQNKAEAIELSQFLKEGAAQIRRKNFGDLRQMIVRYNAHLSVAKNLESSPQKQNPSL